jgi:divalent metal cation (Fe/Co/Zn/Cd) transporter
VGVFLGLLCITIGRRFLEVDLTWVDPVIAIAVAILILVTASSWGNPSWVV